MDASLHKGVNTSRGLKYRYHFSLAQGSHQTLLFCHGFRCTSRDRRWAVPFFPDKGMYYTAPLCPTCLVTVAWTSLQITRRASEA